MRAHEPPAWHSFVNAKRQDMQISNSQFMLMYSLYSWPNVALCFFGGYVIDKWIGIRFGRQTPKSDGEG